MTLLTCVNQQGSRDPVECVNQQVSHDPVYMCKSAGVS